jgi:replicative DNA helicase
MTAAHQRCTALEIVRDPDDTATTPTAGSDDWRAQTVIGQYSPEHQFVGSLMWLTAAIAQPLLELVPDTAIWRPQTRWAYELIRRVINSGNDPTPPTVLAAGRRHAAIDAINPHAAPTAHRQRQLALYLFDAYQQVIAPTTAAGDYAREVLEDAYRRGFTQAGIRMQQLGECDAQPQALTAQFITIRDELADLRRRAEAAAKSGWWQR